MTEKVDWQRDAAVTPTEYHFVEVKRRRRIHPASHHRSRCLAGYPAICEEQRDPLCAKCTPYSWVACNRGRYLMWTPDTRARSNWHNESEAGRSRISV